MSSPVTKEATNLTFGFIGMLLKLLRGEGKIAADGGRADYVAVALDVSGDRGTFRSQIYPEYKATRPPPPRWKSRPPVRGAWGDSVVGARVHARAPSPAPGASSHRRETAVAGLLQRLDVAGDLAVSVERHPGEGSARLCLSLIHISEPTRPY